MKQSELLHETREDEAANLNPRTRIVGMKWVKLGEGKDPEFLRDVILYRRLNLPGTDGDNFAVGYLKSIEVEAEKKIYRFTIESEIFDDFTHYCLPTVPK